MHWGRLNACPFLRGIYMKDIKTRDHVNNIKMIDKSAIAAEHMKSVAIRSREQAADATRNDTESVSDYGSQQIENTASNAAHNAAHAGTAIPRNAMQKVTSHSNSRNAPDSSEERKTDTTEKRSNPFGRTGGSNRKATSGKSGNADKASQESPSANTNGSSIKGRVQKKEPSNQKAAAQRHHPTKQKA